MQYAKDCRLYMKMKVWVATITLCLAFYSSPSAQQAQSNDEASIRALIEFFFAAYVKEDIDGLLALWSASSPRLASYKQGLQKNFTDNERIELTHLSINKLIVKDGQATARLKLDMSAVDAKTGKPAAGFGKMNRTFKLVKEGEKWKVLDYVASEAELAMALVSAKTTDEQKKLLNEEKDLATVELAKALILQGRQLWSQANYSQALSVFQIALDVSTQFGFKIEIAHALRNIGNMHRAQNNNLQALDYYRKSLKVAEEINDKSVIAPAIGNIAIVLNEQGNNTQAIEYYERAIGIDQELGNKPGLARTMNNLAILYHDQGEDEKALEIAQKVLVIAEELMNLNAANYGESFRAQTTIANIYYRQGNYAKALQLYQQCLKIAEKAEDPISLTISQNNIGKIYLAQGNFAQANEAFMKGLQAAQTSGDKEWIGTSFISIGLAYQSQLDNKAALEFFQKGNRMLRELEGGEDDIRALVGTGEIYYSQDNYNDALEYYNKALRLAEAAGQKPGIARILINIGETYYRQESYTKAIELTNRATLLAKGIGIPHLVSRARTLAGRAYRALNQPTQAREAFDDAINSIETVRGQVAGGEQERQRFFEQKISPYYELTELLIEQNKVAEALTYAERAKGRVLLDVLRSGRVNITKAMSGVEQEEERKLNGEIVSLNKQISYENSQQQPNAARLEDLKTRLNRVRLEYESFQTNLYIAHPELKVQRGEIQPLTLEQADTLFDAKTALLEFVVGKEKSYLFVLTKAGGGQADKSIKSGIDIKVYPLSIKSKDLNIQAESFRNALAERNLDYQESARKLYDILLKPAERQLQGKTTLCIVPDGVLWELPFQALQQQENRFLLENHAIFYAPSLSVLSNMMKKLNTLTPSSQRVEKETKQISRIKTLTSSREKQSLLLAVGNPLISSETMNIAKSVHRDEKLGPLPEAEKEVKTLAQIYGYAQSKVLTGADASESKAKSEVGKYRIVHFATHGILDDRNPLYSRVVLSAANEEAEDGLLEAWEIMKMDLRADLVVLSGCQTARGRIGAGEGMIGMSWALFVAGSPTIIASQWKVDSASTSRLMIDFHRRLVSQNKNQLVGTAEAMQDATKVLIKNRESRHPFYWAGFVIVGNGF